MPGTDGIELCQILRDRPDHRQTPILMLTAMTDKSHIDRAFLAGASDYITKPFDIGDLRGRIGLMDSLMSNRKKEAEKSNLADVGLDADNEPLALHEPYHILDVEGVIGYEALENYVSLLSGKHLFESAVFAFSIRGIEDLFEATSRFEYECLVTDVSEAIASSLEKHQFLVSYAGNGTYVCIVEGGWQPDPVKLADQVNLLLHHMVLSFNDGRPMDVKVSAGEIIRLAWKSGDRAMDAVAAANDSAEKESRNHARNLEDFWYSKESA
jgi:CheY-like chemotaxis protein